ncbi:MAG: DNA translocase FtsK [Fimbriiglobus sp.]|jgi:S-DNA-T family DNA segregation ATPase FtsK/SpoIIIE|nr:DNA translocase FtsK [Fimbriiglobus sp.]
MPDPRGPKTRFRLDAVALLLLAAGGVIAFALATYRPLTGRANVIGPASDQFASLLTDAIGLGVLTFVVGWFMWIVLYIAKRSWVRLTVRGFGWLLMAFVSAVAIDLFSVQSGVGPVSAYGPGGALGSWGRFALTDHLAAPLPVVLVSAAGFVGLMLTMDGVLRGTAKGLWWGVKKLAFGASWANDRVGALGDRVLTGLAEGVKAKTVDAPVSLLPAPPPEPTPATPLVGDIPITRHTDLPADPALVAPPAPVSEPDPEPIPITRGPTPVEPPPLRLLSEEEDEAIGDTPASPPSEIGYEVPSLALLADPDPYPAEDREQKLRDRAALLEKTFTDFGLNVKVVGIHTGPVITQYEVSLETGLRLSKVTGLSDDLALNMGVSSVRIVAPLPNRTTVGIEVPNDHRQTVRLKEIIQATTAKAAKYKLPIYLGKDVEGRPLVYDMAAMPHLLIAGRTGTGKSVCLNAIIHSFLLTRAPDDCRLILIDPKKVEFSDYARIPHLMHPVVTDDRKAEAILGWAVDKMEERYELMRRARVRNIAGYNELGAEEILKRVQPETTEERNALPWRLPYIVLVIDEVGDLLMVMKKEVESHIIRLAQKSRAAGIHLILATQKPTVDVITGLIKSNLPARICFQVASRADSAVVLDEKGAEKLLGMGDMLFLQPGTSTIIRGQGAYVDDKEIERVTGELAQYEPNFEAELLNLKATTAAGGDLSAQLRERDPMYEQAIEIVVREQRGSTSLLQRALGIGYGRASRLIDFMAEDGIVGGFNGSNAREVMVTSEEWEERKRA